MFTATRLLGVGASVVPLVPILLNVLGILIAVLVEMGLVRDQDVEKPVLTITVALVIVPNVWLAIVL